MICNRACRSGVQIPGRREKAGGHIALAGTPQEAKALGIHCCPFGVIPKRKGPGKFWLDSKSISPQEPQPWEFHSTIKRAFDDLTFLVSNACCGLATITSCYGHTPVVIGSTVALSVFSDLPGTKN